MTAQKKHSPLPPPPSHFENTWLGQTGIFCLLYLNRLQTVYCQNKGSLLCASLSCVFIKNILLWSCRCKIKERHDPRRWAAVLPIAEKKTEKNSGSDGIWTQASYNTTTTWATEINVNLSALMPNNSYRTPHSPWIFASESPHFKCV